MKKKNSFSSSYRYVNTMSNLNTNLNLKIKNKNLINTIISNNINNYDKNNNSRSKSNNKKNNNLNNNNNKITINTLIIQNNKNSIKNDNSNKNILYHKNIPNNKMLFDKHNSITVKKKNFFSKSKIVNKTQINTNNKKEINNNNNDNNNNNKNKHKKSFSNKNNSFNNNRINKLKNSFSINTNNNYYNYNNNIKINKIISPDISLNKSLPKYNIKNNNIINNIKKNIINVDNNNNNNKLCTSNSFISHTSKLSSKIKLKKNLIHKEKLKNLKINTNPIISIINNKMNTLNNINSNTISNNYNNNINIINNKKNNNKNSISISNRGIRIDNQTLQTNPNKLPIKIKNEFSNYFSARNHNKSKNIIINNDNSNINIFKINNNNSINNNNIKHNIIINHKKASSNNMYIKTKINPSFRTLNKNIKNNNNNLKKSNINIDIEINSNINKNKNNIDKNNLNKNAYKRKKPINNNVINNLNDNSINNIINNNVNINANKTSMKLSKNTKSKSQNVFSNKINESNYHTFNSPISTKLSPTIKKQWEKNLLSINNNNTINNMETDALNYNELLMNFNSPIKQLNSINIYKNNIINSNNKNSNINNNNNIIKRIMKIDSRTIAGFSSPQDQKLNQDNFFIEKDYLGQSEHFFLGICDGHGVNGHLISEYVSNYLPDFITDSSDPTNIINGFIKCNNALTTSTDIDCTLSGSTCVSLFISLDKIICANIGDSRAVLARYENGNYNTIKISRDHKPTEFDEMKRILENNGRIEKYYDTDFDAFVGPKRIWLKNSDIPGLAMTRSFGDVIGHNVGVTSEPEITKTIFDGSERFAIIASDGVWEYIDSEESVEIVKDFYENDLDANGAVESLVKEAFNRWKREEDTVDDITAIVVFFEE